MCKHQYEHSGTPVYGSNIPLYAQGTCFPGDESGTYCNIAKAPCRNQTGDNLEDCYATKATEWACPVCIEYVEIAKLAYNDTTETYFCRVCGNETNKADLSQAYISLFMQMVAEEKEEYIKRKKIEADYIHLRNKHNRLQTKLIELAQHQAE